jgi:NADPH:quinone reductase-like Zn-dependent oxidoreductase
VAIDYRAGDFVAAVRRITSGRKGGAGVDAAFDAIGGAHFSRSFASLANGGLLVGYGSQAMAVGHEGLLAAGLGLARLKVWSRLTFLFGKPTGGVVQHHRSPRDAPRRVQDGHGALFDLLREGAIHPVVVDRLPIAAAREVHHRIDAGGLGGKIVLPPWPEPE